MGEEAATKPGSADHLVVLVHGLWGNPKHLEYVASSLREKYAEDKAYVLVAARNSGSFTYDGIELGGERVTQEVEETIEELERGGQKITKLSFMGYSLGGLVARYAVGLLYNRGWFEKLEPVNFTTFATPHLGVRTPLVGYHNHLWNVLGARMLSMSGRQLFLTDKFRDTGRPLLSVLADPDSIFIRALSRFRNRSLYANIVNDRSAVYYTTSISKTDPFVKPDAIKINYVPGYDDIIVDAKNPVSPRDEEALYQRLYGGGRNFIRRMPFFAFICIFLPVALTVFSVTSVVQTARSKQRIKLHEAGKLGIKTGMYRIPLMIQDVRQTTEDIYENVANTHDQEYLPDDSIEAMGQESPLLSKSNREQEKLANGDSPAHTLEFPTLALTSDQFAMVQALDDVGFEKHPVHIHNVNHSHAAIIVRMPVERFYEGKVVIRHWLERFEI
ncbi:lipase/serine esteras-like protein [Rhizodiscina lignyota]|uniref:Lipase/serine esteras-like protein n=1 Tax=Rhizodiscina lignyota TaxID=1504668 RepID=A0A9P4INH4_9PEZI|nr:lipase/serine esteras-like protein [Rhizodiscina lignyota]